MFITEWNELKKAVAPVLFDNVEVQHYPITSEIRPPIGCTSGQSQGEYHLEWIDYDYNIGQELSLTVGPFSAEKRLQAEKCITQIVQVLQGLNYEYIASYISGNTIGPEIVGTIVFKRTPDVDAHVRDYKERDL